GYGADPRATADRGAAAPGVQPRHHSDHPTVIARHQPLSPRREHPLVTSARLRRRRRHRLSITHCHESLSISGGFIVADHYIRRRADRRAHIGRAAGTLGMRVSAVSKRVSRSGLQAASGKYLHRSKFEQPMSALPPKADMDWHCPDVRFVAKNRHSSALFDFLVITRALPCFTTQFQRSIQLAVWLCVTDLAAAQ